MSSRRNNHRFHPPFAGPATGVSIVVFPSSGMAPRPSAGGWSRFFDDPGETIHCLPIVSWSPRMGAGSPGRPSVGDWSGFSWVTGGIFIDLISPYPEPTVDPDRLWPRQPDVHQAQPKAMERLIQGYSAEKSLPIYPQ